MNMALLLCALSCTREVPYILEDSEDQLILNAQIDASSVHHKAWIGISKTSTIAQLADATLTCSVNGKDVSFGILDEDLSRNSVQTCYIFDASLHPGDVVRLTARGAGLSAYAEVSVPDTTGRMLSVDTLSVDSAMRFKVHIRDDVQDRNYYRLQVKTKSSQSYRYEGAWTPWYEHVREATIKHKNDPILDGRLGGSQGDDFYGIGSNTNHYCIFTDRLFAGGNAEISFMVDDIELRKIYADQYYDSIRAICYASVSLVSMGRAEFDYLNILNVLYDDDYDSSEMLELVTVPTNVVNGTGFVGVFIPSTINVRMPDIEVGGMYKL